MVNYNKVNFMKKNIFLIGVTITSIGLLLPWVNTIFGNYIGISTWGGYFVLAFLAINVCLFFFLRDKEKLVSAVLIITGIFSIIIVFPPKGLVSNPIVSYGIGTYITLIGSIFIVIAGIVGLFEQGKNEKNRIPFED
jgi:uncharacterized membrane protein